jgi:hypothetical protein
MPEGNPVPDNLATKPFPRRFDRGRQAGKTG